MSKTEEEFIEIVATAAKGHGFDDLSSKIIGILYIEPKELSLDEIAQKTGYSLASISNSVKAIENARVIKRLKKPKSHKTYFFMEKDLNKLTREMISKKYNAEINPAKEKLPGMIKTLREQTKSSKKDDDKKKLGIMENYLEQIHRCDEILAEILKKIS